MENTLRRSRIGDLLLFAPFRVLVGQAGVLLPLLGLLLVAECLSWDVHVNTAHAQPRRIHPRRAASSYSHRYAASIDDEVLEGRKIYKNPRNAPSVTCPRDEAAILRTGRECLRRCNGDGGCLSRRKICMCDGSCGLSCVNPEKECGDLENPLFGFVEFTGRRVGSLATYKCQQGYHLLGEERRVCQGNGEWAASPPECRENLYCTNPPIIAHARHDGIESRTRFEVNHTLKYACEEGYSTRGFDVAKCFLYNNTMQWFGPEIVCHPKECGDPGEILNGFKEDGCFHYDCRVSYHCRPGFEMEGRNVYRCHQDGTWMPRELPNCKPIQCDIPDNPRHGKASFNSVFYNAVVTYSCDYGYMIVGPETRRCGPDREWSGVTPSCKEIDCGHPGILHNGRLEGTYTSYNYGTEIRFVCNDNMKYEGYHDRRTVCQKNGTWSNPLPKCLAPCIVPTVENGRLTNESQAGTLVPHGSVIRVVCNKTYEPSFTSVPSACYNGTWTHYPHCEPARCKKLPRRPRNGMVIAPRTAHGMLARFRCKDGYILKGAVTTKCHFGKWTGRIPWCKVVYCPFPGYLADGRVLLVGNMGMYIYRPYVRKVRNDRRIRYECNKGYYLSSGPPGATCVAGKWSPSAMPSCSPKLHPRVRWTRSVNASDFPEHMNFSTEVEVEVDDEEEEEEDEEEEMEAIGTALEMEEPEYAEEEEAAEDEEKEEVLAENEMPEEEEEEEANSGKEKEDKFIVFPLLVEASDLTHSAHYTDDDAALPGTPDGPTLPAARPTPPSSPLSKLSFRPKKYSESKRHLETWAKFIQEERNGVEVSKILIREEEVAGERRSARQESSRISRSPKRQDEGDEKKRKGGGKNKAKKRRKGKRAPHCEELPEEPYLRVEVVRPGRDTNYTFSAGARVKVTCLYGHGLNLGNKTAKCSRGRWRPMKPECISLPCSVPETPHGRYTFNGVQVPERATIGHAEVVGFSCGSGYTVLGTPTLRCWYGEWTVTGTRPECQPEPCWLPEVTHGNYTGALFPGGHVAHGQEVDYACEEGWLVGIPRVTCHLGHLRPVPPTCVTPAEATHPQDTLLTPLVRTASIMLTYGAGDLISGGDITSIDLEAGSRPACSPPAKVQGTLIYKNGQPLHQAEQRFPHGTEVTFNCIANTMGEKTTWRIHCEAGSWIGQRASSPCPAVEEEEEEEEEEEKDVTRLEKKQEEDVNLGNTSCMWRNSQPNLVTFLEDRQLREEALELPPGTELVSRCSDIGKFAFSGSSHRRCVNGQWSGAKPTCLALNREYDYALDKPPTILFRHKNGPIAQTNDGRLLVYPGTELYLECLWMRRYGTPRWNVTHTHPNYKYRKFNMRCRKLSKCWKYWTGWTTDAMRNPQLEFRLAIYTAHEGDSGAFSCVTPTGHTHTVTLDIRRVECPPINSSDGDLLRHIPPGETALGTLVTFICEHGARLVGAAQATCLPSGLWSAPPPRCEKARCPSPGVPEHGVVGSAGPFSAGDVVEIKCKSRYMIAGEPLLVCQDDGTWSRPLPKCAEVCTYPGINISGTMSSVKFYYAVLDTITYACSDGFLLHGEHTITCQEGGRWSAPVPTCLPTP
ncbi:uncharacterized protein LOC126999691 isoform X2 [Eriocheir sinensis]|uniref:uncharacterized protein LOC126999691 isoform X2 n=1 Tax=Eriocheir sinensis TaxID=95602 RepID=UPI0021C99CD2|nr:uncharacterized protein LOC126999691 isoform X2 [Eriocheir sinensis]